MQSSARAHRSPFIAWAFATGAALVLVVAAVGVSLGYGLPDTQAANSLARLFALVALSSLIAVPVAWVATLGRGLLAGIAARVVIVVIAPFSVVAGVGGWMPIAAPALWAMSPDTVSPLQLVLTLLVPLVFWPATVMTWVRMQLGR